MRKITTAALSGVAALVLAGGGLGVAAAHNDPEPATHTPAVSVWSTTQPTPVSRQARSRHHVTEPSKVASTRAPSTQRCSTCDHIHTRHQTQSGPAWSTSDAHHGDHSDHAPRDDGHGCDD